MPPSTCRPGAWLTRDFFQITRWKVVPVILCGAAYIAMKFAAMGVIYLCVRALSEDLPVTIPGVNMLAPKSPEFVLLSVSVGVALLIATAYFRYEVRRRAIELGRRYEERCARRIILVASRLPDPRAKVASRVIGAGSLNQYPGYARRSASSCASSRSSCPPSRASWPSLRLCCGWISG